VDYLDANEIIDIAKNLRNFVIANFKNKILVSDKNFSVENLKKIREVKGEKGNFSVYVFKEKDSESVKKAANL